CPYTTLFRSGCMRADSYKLPIIRMTNVSLEPGDWDYDELIEDTQDGILMDTNYGWSIDQKRYNFQFNCEKGYRIKNGSLGEMIRGPGYSGITPEFWNACDAVGNQKSWVLWGPRTVERVSHSKSWAQATGLRLQGSGTSVHLERPNHVAEQHAEADSTHRARASGLRRCTEVR